MNRAAMIDAIIEAMRAAYEAEDEHEGTADFVDAARYLRELSDSELRATFAEWCDGE
jgi:hypothetical protein